jgi:hypothetical protein
VFRLLISYIKSLFTPTDITLTLNGSQLTFTKEGDVKLAASRSLITEGKYIFLNGKPEEIDNILFNNNLCLEQLEEEIL